MCFLTDAQMCLVCYNVKMYWFAFSDVLQTCIHSGFVLDDTYNKHQGIQAL